MTDSSTQPQAGQKSPLDILEDVLKDAKNASQSKKEAAQAQEEQQKIAELEKLRVEKAAQDEKLIQEQLLKMKQEVTQMPAEKARQAQGEEEKEKTEKQKSSQDGYEIRQLGHTKV